MSEVNHEIHRPLPKNAFDREYMTEYGREVKFLAEKGIRYTFVRRTRDYGVSQYKYKKTPALFSALVEFYSMLDAERETKSKLTPEKIREAQEILRLAAEQIKKEDDTI